MASTKILKFDNITSGFNSVSNLTLNKWQHLGFVLSYPNTYIYIDGIRTGSATTTKYPKKIVRNKNYIGKSSWADPNANAVFDDIKIFNRDLSEQEIKSDMNNRI